ncbi:very low-density lipoprotein receptor-like [Limulus polyphemus]|uniref:Very low-density lipoprotein receptor-like n=1 Tax=Limulus polyphemus TaxID=6850 RepID=A0ABM1S7M2_LIMPO|nr:very low-density lipoprotein receptor-like [Limulus polyphemus]
MNEQQNCHRRLSSAVIMVFVICTLYSSASSHQSWTSNQNGLLLPSSVKLGSSCKSSLVCLLFIPNSYCSWDKGICSCRFYHVQFNHTTCLPPTLLGFGCAIDAQCQVKVKNSRCVNGLCECQPNFIPFRLDKCLPVAKIGDYCLNHEQCRLSDKYTYCDWIISDIYGKCQCPLKYLLTGNKRCLPLLGNKCKTSEDCNEATPGSYCKKHKKITICECREGFRSSKNKLRCERNKIQDPVEQKISSATAISLGKRCSKEAECQARDRYSTCINGTCECIAKTSSCNADNTGCLKDTFQCRNGQCVSWFFVCDGKKNCVDGTDEDECLRYKCPKESFQCNDGSCLSRSVVCNGRWECPDGSDEARCYKGIVCDKYSFQCASGQCLPQYSLCNAVTDCKDGSDELEAMCTKGETCPSNGFLCNNGQCRSTAVLCSGLDGCGDNSDEDRCDVCYCEKP